MTQGMMSPQEVAVSWVLELELPVFQAYRFKLGSGPPGRLESEHDYKQLLSKQVCDPQQPEEKGSRGT
jgi:hypothetical protein